MSVNIRSFQEVERRIAHLTSKNEDVSKKVGTTLKVSNKMNSFFNSLIINLKDLLKNQSEISLWFFDEDVPNLTNKPTSDWATTEYSKHYGDIFYSKTKGRIYEFNNSVWSELNDESLRKAMALTDSQLETNDNERKVFVSTPSPPYESGDWYIHDDGLLYICQVGRTGDKYVETDFISSVDYAGAVAEKTGNQTIITKGTVITETAEAVTYLDKSTNTTSTISGDSIRTGSISSNNYKHNESGMRINLNQGTIDTKNFKLDEYGNARLYNGAQVISDKGLLTNLQFFGKTPNSSFDLCGCTANMESSEINPQSIIFTIVLPQNFTVVNAFVQFVHIPIFWHYGTSAWWGYSRDLALFKDSMNKKSEWYRNSDYGYDEVNVSQIQGLVWKNVAGRNIGKECRNTWKAEVPTDANFASEVVVSNDITTLIKLKDSSIQKLLLRPAYIPAYVENGDELKENEKICAERTANVSATINVYGYSNF